MSAVAEEVKLREKEDDITDVTVTPELSVKEQIVAKLDNLPVERLQQLLDFAEFLENKVAKPQAAPEVDAAAPETQPNSESSEGEKGLSPAQEDAQNFVPDAEERLSRLRNSLAHLNIRVTEEDIAEARREMWGNFPREDEQIWGDYLLKGDSETK